MLTEADREKSNKTKVESGIRLCEDAIAKAEKYERLKDNKDWQGHLEDLKVLMTLHDREIKMAIGMIIDAPFTSYVKKNDVGQEVMVSSRQDWTEFIARHEIQRTDCENWIKEPDRIIAMATLAREKLPMLREKLSELSDTIESNGKS